MDIARLCAAFEGMPTVFTGNAIADAAIGGIGAQRRTHPIFPGESFFSRCPMIYHLCRR